MIVGLSIAFAAAPTSTGFISFPAGASGEPVCDVYIVVGDEQRADAALVAGCERPFVDQIQQAVATWQWADDEPSHVERWSVHFFQRAPSAKHVRVEEFGAPVTELVETRHRSALKPLSRPRLPYPDLANGDPASCKGTLWIESATGKVLDASVEDCVAPFAEPARASLTGWTFAPVESSSRWVRTKMMVEFVKPPPPVPLTDWAGVLTVDLLDPAVPAQTRRFRPATCVVTTVIRENGRAVPQSVTGCHERLRTAARSAVERSDWSHLVEPAERLIEVSVPFEK